MNLDKLLDEGAGITDGMSINPEVKEYLYETGKWARFLSIIGFVSIGLMVIGAFSSLMLLGEFSGLSDAYGGIQIFIIFIYIIIAALYFYPILQLFKFGKNIKIALEREDQRSLIDAFRALKSHYKFLGIMTAIVIVLYVILIVFGMFGAFFSGF